MKRLKLPEENRSWQQTITRPFEARTVLKWRPSSPPKNCSADIQSGAKKASTTIARLVRYPPSCSKEAASGFFTFRAWKRRCFSFRKAVCCEKYRITTSFGPAPRHRGSSRSPPPENPPCRPVWPPSGMPPVGQVKSQDEGRRAGCRSAVAHEKICDEDSWE